MAVHQITTTTQQKYTNPGINFRNARIARKWTHFPENGRIRWNGQWNWLGLPSRRLDRSGTEMDKYSQSNSEVVNKNTILPKWNSLSPPTTPIYKSFTTLEFHGKELVAVLFYHLHLTTQNLMTQFCGVTLVACCTIAYKNAFTILPEFHILQIYIILAKLTILAKLLVAYCTQLISTIIIWYDCAWKIHTDSRWLFRASCKINGWVISVASLHNYQFTALLHRFTSRNIPQVLHTTILWIVSNVYSLQLGWK